MSILKLIKWFFRIVAILLLAFVFFVVYISISDYKPDEVVELEIKNDSGLKINTQDSTLSFVSWNIGYCGLGKEMDFFYDKGRRVRAYKFSYEKFKEGIRKRLKSFEGTDFMLIQEIDLHSKRTYYDDQYEWMLKLLPTYSVAFAKNYDVRFIPVPPLSPLGRVKAGMATFSVFSPVESSRHAFTENFSWPKRLFMLDRCFILNRYELEGGKQLVVINTHNSAFDDGSLREAQMDKLRQFMLEEYEKGNYVVAGGDWNLNPVGYQFGPVVTGDYMYAVGQPIAVDFLPPGWTWAYDPKVPTNRRLNAAYLKNRVLATIIDYFILSPNIALEELKTHDLGFEDSDHHPVEMKIRLL